MAKVTFNYVRLDCTEKANPKLIPGADSYTVDDTQPEVKRLLDVVKTGTPCVVPGLQGYNVSRQIIVAGMSGRFQFFRDGDGIMIAQVFYVKNKESREALENLLRREIAVEKLSSLPQAPVAVACVLCNLSPGVGDYLVPAAAAGFSDAIY